MSDDDDSKDKEKTDKPKTNGNGASNIELFPPPKLVAGVTVKRDDTAQVQDPRLKISEFSQRIGRFEARSPYVQSVMMAKILKALAFVPMSVTFDHIRATFIYVGYSPSFDIKSSFDPPPEYTLTVKAETVPGQTDVIVTRKPAT